MRPTYDRLIDRLSGRHGVPGEVGRSMDRIGGAEWQPDAERRAAPLAFARGIHGAAVQFDQVTRDRQAQPESAVRAGRGAVALTEPLEDVWEKFGRDANPRVGHDDFRVVVVRRETDRHVAAG